MYLKYSALVVCCVMSSLQASDFSKKSKEMLGAIVRSTSATSVSSQERISKSSSTSILQPVTEPLHLYYEYPGASSPVYYISDHYQVVAALRSPTRSGFPCGR